MAGFLLTGGGGGCPPTATPPSGYKNPFRFDSSGKLWITSCFQGFQYFGAARHDITSAAQPGNSGINLSTTNPIYNGTAITAGKATTRVITNTTQCTMGILLGYDAICDIQIHEDSWVQLALVEYWNGARYNHGVVTNKHLATGGGEFARATLHTSANPHDTGADAAGGSTLQLAPGASATIAAKFFMSYMVGSTQPGDVLYSASSAVRIYGYVLG